jgi:hypothetical protein
VSSPAAWHPDPSGAHEHRYWDGERWTEHVADGGVAAIDPLPAAPPAGAGTRTPERTEDRPTEDHAAADRPAEDHAAADRPAEDHAAADRPAEAHPAEDRPTEDRRPADADAPPAWERADQPSGDAPYGGQQPSWAGHSSSGPTWGQSATAPASNGMAVTALVLGIVSLPLLIFFGLGGLLGIAAVVVGIIAVRRVNRGEATGRGMAIGGIATGAISALLGVLIIIALFAFGIGFAGELERCIEETGSQQVCQERLERQLRDRFLGE